MTKIIIAVPALQIGGTEIHKLYLAKTLFSAG